MLSPRRPDGEETPRLQPGERPGPCWRSGTDQAGEDRSVSPHTQAGHQATPRTLHQVSKYCRTALRYILLQNDVFYIIIKTPTQAISWLLSPVALVNSQQCTTKPLRFKFFLSFNGFQKSKHKKKLSIEITIKSSSPFDILTASCH